MKLKRVAWWRFLLCMAILPFAFVLELSGAMLSVVWEHGLRHTWWHLSKVLRQYATTIRVVVAYQFTGRDLPAEWAKQAHEELLASYPIRREVDRASKGDS